MLPAYIISDNQAGMDSFEGSSIMKRRTEIRNRMRRDELEEYFQRRRQEFIQWERSILANNHIQLDTPNLRIQFVDSVEEKLKNTDISQWGHILQQIKPALRHFQSCMQLWVGEQGKVLKVLREGFPSPTCSDDVKRGIVRILTDMMSYQPQPGMIAAGIYFFQMEDDVVRYLKEACVPVLAFKPFLHFLACLARSSRKYRHKLVKMGAGQFLIQYGREFLRSQLATDEKERRDFLGICGDFVTRFKDKARNIVNLDFVEQVLEMAVDLTEMGGDKAIEQGLSTICCIGLIENANKLPMFSSNRFIRRIIEFSREAKVQPFALSVLFLICRAEKKEATERLFKEGVLDAFWEIFNQEPARTSQVTIINSLLNLGFEEIEIRTIVGHNAWRIVIEGLSSDNSLIKREAYDCLTSIFHNADTSSLKTQILNSQIVNLMMEDLTNYLTGDRSVTRSALGLLKKHIQFLIQEKNKRGLLLLDSLYRIDGLLEELVNHSMGEIQSEAQAINQIYSSGLMEDCEGV